MATITFSVNSGIVTGSKSYTLTDAEVQRMVDAYRPYATSGASNAQILLAWAGLMMSDTKTYVLQTEQTGAAKAVTPINPT